MWPKRELFLTRPTRQNPSGQDGIFFPLGSLEDYRICFILTAHGFNRVINIFSIITHGDYSDIHALIGPELRHIAIITSRGVIIAGG